MTLKAMLSTNDGAGVQHFRIHALVVVEPIFKVPAPVSVTRRKGAVHDQNADNVAC